MNELSDSNWDLAHSPFNAIIDTNHSPSLEELAQLKEYLVEPKVQLSKLESEIARVKAALDELYIKRDRVKMYVNAHEALTSPIRRFPSEMLSEIFIACLPTAPYAIRSLKEAPLLLTAICRRWRRTAINTPRLWTSLHIFLPSFITESVSQRQAGTDLWLKRSEPLPLSLSLCISPHEQDAKQRMLPFLEAIRRNSDRLGHLSIALPAGLIRSLWSQLPQHLPLLNSLHIRPTEGCFFDRDLSDLVLPLKQASSLRKLSISRLAASANYLVPVREWGNLTELSLDAVMNWNISDVLFLLSKTPLLVSFTLVIGRSRDSETAQLSVRLLHLHTMNISKHPGDGSGWELAHPHDRTCIPDLFAHITCPSLRSLTVNWEPGPIVAQCPVVALPLHNLALLRLNIAMASKALSQCLSLAPNITFLEISDRSIGLFDVYTLKYYHLSALTLIPSGHHAAPVCPNLQTIRISVAPRNEKAISGAALLSLIESRAKSLKTFDILLPSEDLLAEETVLRLRTLKSAGLQLRIKCHRHRARPDEPSLGLLSESDMMDVKDVITLV